MYSNLQVKFARFTACFIYHFLPFLPLFSIFYLPSARIGFIICFKVFNKIFQIYDIICSIPMILANTFLNDIFFFLFLQNITEANKDTEMRQADKRTVKKCFRRFTSMEQKLGSLLLNTIPAINLKKY